MQWLTNLPFSIQVFIYLFFFPILAGISAGVRNVYDKKDFFQCFKSGLLGGLSLAIAGVLLNQIGIRVVLP